MIQNIEILTENPEPIVLSGRAERLTCKYCGKEYLSRGKHDPGYCKECGLVFLNGPLDGKKVGEIRDNQRGKTETG